jgi:hypothetical protein
MKIVKLIVIGIWVLALATLVFFANRDPIYSVSFWVLLVSPLVALPALVELSRIRVKFYWERLRERFVQSVIVALVISHSVPVWVLANVYPAFAYLLVVLAVSHVFAEILLMVHRKPSATETEVARMDSEGVKVVTANRNRLLSAKDSTEQTVEERHAELLRKLRRRI